MTFGRSGMRWTSRFAVTVFNGAKAGRCWPDSPAITATNILRSGTQMSAAAHPCQETGGPIVMVPSSNKYMRRSGVADVIFSPARSKSLKSRVFPVRRTFARERIAYAITTSVISRCDYCWTCHCCDGKRIANGPYVVTRRYWARGTWTSASRICRALRFRSPSWVDAGGRWIPRRRCIVRTKRARAANRSLTVERDFCLACRNEKSAKLISAGVENVFAVLKMTAGAPRRLESVPVFLDPGAGFYESVTGILNPIPQSISSIPLFVLTISLGSSFL